MHTVLIITAIFIAIVLLFNYIAPQARPLFKIAERLPTDVIIAKLRMLGLSCAVTKNGFGIKYSFVKPKRLLNTVMRRHTDKSVLWRSEFINNADYINAAFSDCKKDVISGAYCGHVNGFPRVFLFCKTLCECSGGDISVKLLSDGLSAFEKKSKLTEREREILPSYMIYCLVGYMCTVVSDELRKSAVYDKGATDGQSGKVALDYIDYGDYVCGLIEHTSADELDAVKQLLDCNCLDTDAAIKKRKNSLAYTYAVIKSVLRSIKAVPEWKKEVCPAKPAVHVPHKRIVISKVLILALIVVYGIFTCIFASPQYVALFVVAAVLTYIGIRIPLLYGVDALLDFTRINRLFKIPKLKKRVTENSPVRNREYMTETAYFGGGTEYALNSVDCGYTTVRADNRGTIYIDSSLSGRINTFCLDLSCQVNGTDISLCECDGVFLRHKSLYHLAKRDVEFSAQIISAVDSNACLIELCIINRTGLEHSGTITTVLTGERCRTRRVEFINNGATVQSDEYCVALHAGDGARYGGNVREFLFGKPLQTCCDGRLALIGQNDFSVKPFAKNILYAYAVFGKSKREVESVIRYVSSDGFFEYATCCAEQFCVSNQAPPFPDSLMEEMHHCNESAEKVYESPNITEEKSVISLSDVKILQSGEYVTTDGFTPHENIISNGIITAKLNRFGVQSVRFGKSVTAAEDDVMFNPQAYIVIGEHNVFWSPSLKPLGKGETVYKNGFGYSEYVCSYNGTVSCMRCFIYGDDTLVFEVKIKNNIEVARELSVMFSLLSATDKLCYEDGVLSLGGKRAVYLHSLPSADCMCQYKEGYFNRGRIDRVSDFRDGGNTPAPTISVKKQIEPNGEIIIGFALSSREHNVFDNLDVQSAYEKVEKIYNRLGKIGLHSDDTVLNISYKRALYVVYNFGFLANKSMPASEMAFVYGCVKYINHAAVKDRLIGQMIKQHNSGCLSDSRIDGLYFAYSVMDYVNFSGDKDFLREVYSFLPSRSNGKTLTERAPVYEHCLRAIDTSVGRLYFGGNKFHSIINERITLLLINYFADYIKLSSAREKRYIALYRNVAGRYAQSVKYIKSDCFFRFKSVEDAYLCAYLLFSADENEKAYNILKYNNPIERLKHYDGKTESVDLDCSVLGSAIYYLTVTEMLLGISMRGKRIRLLPKTSADCPQIELDLYGKTNDAHVLIDSAEPVGSWKMRVDRISYSSDSVDISDLSGDIIFYRDGIE